ncbi:NrpR regulatory domain-containing protein [uncultured Methanosphaera sp.]|uniref:NrpR regulatory domain-containing protein n=1 Tax=uncultured Methanosphaera sp. TaxID=262501 RepID=UPI0028038F01|nr:NrpR regulatory domain-containing protein [uncultured Methanosphaera sp.]
MKQETDMKMMEILRILYNKNEILGAKVISEELEKRGYSLGERAVRYHMHILDEKELTEKVGYKGRKITKKGIEELKKGLIYDQVDFTSSLFQEKMYNVTLEPRTSKGSVIVNLSSINDLESIKPIINDVFDVGLAVSDRYNIIQKDDKKYIETVCGTTIDGVFQKKGIISKPICGGLLQIEDNMPINFIEQISYTKTSITPLEAFTGQGSTSVLDVISSGTGVIPANFRMIPAVKKPEAIHILNQLAKIGISGVITMGEVGKSVLGIPVKDGMIGIAIIGGVAPLCAAQEEGFDLNVKLADTSVEYSSMKSDNLYTPKLPFKAAHSKVDEVTFLMNKIYNIISEVTYDVNKEQGNVITNISYLKREYLDDAIEIMNEVYKKKPEYCVGNKYSVINAKDNMVGIATLCSLTVDGILTNHGVSSTPEYSGVLDIYGNNKRFIDLISYEGSSIDPHEIFIKKNMQNIQGSLDDDGKILASVHTVPYIARDMTIDIFELLEDSGLGALNIGKPNEYTYNARVEKYNFGYVLSGGLNPIAAVHEKGIPVDVKSLETIMDYNLFEEL